MLFSKQSSQKKEAISRMKTLGLSAIIVDDYKETGLPQIYEPPYGASYYPDEEEDSVLLKEINSLKKRGYLVWGIIRCTMSYNRKPVTVDCMLFVSGDKKEWPAERNDLYNGFPFVFTCCKEIPSLHDHGSISIYMSEGGTPLRKAMY